MFKGKIPSGFSGLKHTAWLQLPKFKCERLKTTGHEVSCCSNFYSKSAKYLDIKPQSHLSLFNSCKKCPIAYFPCSVKGVRNSWQTTARSWETFNIQFSLFFSNLINGFEKFNNTGRVTLELVELPGILHFCIWSHTIKTSRCR